MKIDSAGALDLAGDLPVEPCRDSGELARKDFPRLGGELAQILGLFEVDLINANIVAPPRHALIGFAKVDLPLRCFRFHKGVANELANLAVKRALFHEGIEFNLFEATGSPHALLIARGDVTGWRHSRRAGLGAFEGDDISGHNNDGERIKEKRPEAGKGPGG
jgi:hypothetical protein